MKPLIDTLVPNPNNPRRLSKDAFEKLKRSLSSFTKMLEIRPIAYDDDNVVWGGNMRLLALRELYRDRLVDVKPSYFKKLTDFTLEEKKEFAIRDNIEFGEWDDNILANEWSDLPLDEWGLDTGGQEGDKVVEDEAPGVSTEPAVSKLGEVYQLGRHRLMCGDSTKIEDVEKLMNGQKADISFTSPPYNAGQTPTEVKMGLDKKYENYDDDKSSEEYLSLLNITTLLSLEHSEYSFVNLQSISGNKIALIDFLYQTKNKYADTVIWDKLNSQPAMAANVLNSEYEYVHIFSNKANRAVGTKDFRGTLKNIVHISKQNSNETKTHHATFPVEFVAHFVSNFSREDKGVLDLFGGSGSTLIACEQLNRTCFMSEIDERYCDVIRKRYWKFVTGSEEGWIDGTKAL